MSATFGVLEADKAYRFDDNGDRPGRGVDEPSIGEWHENQDELEYSVYADTSMTLPGNGETGPSCGDWFPTEFCDECGNVMMAPNRCERRICPNCVGIWTKQRAVGATRRIQAARWAENDGIDRRVVHAVVSHPEGSIRTLQQVYGGYKDAYDLARDKGVRGGIAVFHGFRVLDEVQAVFRETNPDMGIWRWIQRERSESWRTLTYWSPHYHIIGLSRDFEADNPDVQDGWVARRIRSLESMKSLHRTGSYEDMVGLVRYLMSHATFESGTTKDCVRWFGDLATCKFQPESELSVGAIDTIDRITNEVVGVVDTEDSEGHLDESEPCEECGSSSRSPIWDAGGALTDPGWCERIGRERERRLIAAFEWALGERHPPPGLKRPRSNEDAREALEAMVA